MYGRCLTHGRIQEFEQSKLEVKKMFEEMDADGSGEVSQHELIEFITTHEKVRTSRDRAAWDPWVGRWAGWRTDWLAGWQARG